MQEAGGTVADDMESMERRIVQLTTAAANARSDAELTAATTALDAVYQELMEAQRYKPDTQIVPLNPEP